ncbi:MAG: YitT family protein [Bombilactobacillus mellis]|uniref:YitT family protein n=1 Tax=Bombilactobacillus mellis TaxID=1218508 RepID=UPI0015806A6E|nr:YitT family protein [Bombilactobacillus mellis]MCT6807085.1 YitT family protein [Bombilactobacillus sp.]MCT6840625.1 YitT family protein [Bombilactobacillus mellis]MCT6856434.1 YitT family protein [Bombilactobacillus mellis]MCT6872652.1 YitT family protein [Bombilactobacillus mellis]MCX0279431.1 YitT family protein [Bombilactobacillus mellis]
MNELEKIARRYRNIAKLSFALIYALCVSVAVNVFWNPGKIYGSGITGLAQLISTISQHWLPFTIGVPVLYATLNLPLLILSWKKIGHEFTFYTIVAVILSTVLLHIIPPVEVKFDPIICAIFGGLFNGVGTGLALKNEMSTGGLDIISIVLRKKLGKSVGTINIAFNILVVLGAGCLFGWVQALYTILSIFVNGRVIDSLYTRNQKLQVIIVTSHPDKVITEIQNEMRRGITIVHDVEGAYQHSSKTMLFTVISQYELPLFRQALQDSDPYAFVSMTEAKLIMGRFYQEHIY